VSLFLFNLWDTKLMPPSAKYGYSVVKHLIDALGEIASAYDIGCRFGKMVYDHPILGPLPATTDSGCLWAPSTGMRTTAGASSRIS
jgi:hypothetical protein